MESYFTYQFGFEHTNDEEKHEMLDKISEILDPALLKLEKELNVDVKCID